MNSDEDENMMFSLGHGCTIHGDEYLRDCSTCGHEFCSRCTPRSTVCEECAEEAAEATDVLPGEDVAGIADDTAVEALIEEADELPAEDLVDDDEKEPGDDRA